MPRSLTTSGRKLNEPGQVVLRGDASLTVPLVVTVCACVWHKRACVHVCVDICLCAAAATGAFNRRQRGVRLPI